MTYQPNKLLSSNPKSLLGAHITDRVVDFAVYSPQATRVELCLYSNGETQEQLEEQAKIELKMDEHGIWKASVEGIGIGTQYGYRAHGKWAPESNQGMFDPEKLLLDPYGKAVAGKPNFHPSMLHGQGDSAEAGLRSVVIDPHFDWEGDTSPEIPWDKTSIYELHVKGFTELLPDIPEELRGTYAGLAHPNVVKKIKDLGVTSVQLLPIHQHLNEGFLTEKGLTNYWGYSTLGFFAPHNEWGYSTDPVEQIREFKGMIKSLHQAGLEVILDVVYNHTCEGGIDGPILSFRGLDDDGYYLRDPKTKKHYWESTGCGNTFRIETPSTLQLILDSMRYWVESMHVDGFRFDLATTLGREEYSFNHKAAFFRAIYQDPVLSKIKLIAEPWDTGQMDSYQVGAFPMPWREFNDQYRDNLRKFWRGDADTAGEIARGLTGSERILAPNKGTPLAGINFVTCHDGFTLRDIVSYNNKQNQANLEDSRDGTDNNHSWKEQSDYRLQQQANLLATLILSPGIPFILSGDERNRTQQGNNNTYCQDNELSWIDWNETPETKTLEQLVIKCLELRRTLGIDSQAKFYNGEINPDTGNADVTWLENNGHHITKDQWHGRNPVPFIAQFTVPSHYLIILNPLPDSLQFLLPTIDQVQWQETLTTQGIVNNESKNQTTYPGGETITIGEKSLSVLKPITGNSHANLIS